MREHEHAGYQTVERARRKLRWREITIVVVALLVAVGAGLLMRHHNETHPAQSTTADIRRGS